MSMRWPIRNQILVPFALLMLGAVPFALGAFSNQLCGVDMSASDQVELHIERVLATFFPEPSVSL